VKIMEPVGLSVYLQCETGCHVAQIDAGKHRCPLAPQAVRWAGLNLRRALAGSRNYGGLRGTCSPSGIQLRLWRRVSSGTPQAPAITSPSKRACSPRRSASEVPPSPSSPPEESVRAGLRERHQHFL